MVLSGREAAKSAVVVTRDGLAGQMRRLSKHIRCCLSSRSAVQPEHLLWSGWIVDGLNVTGSMSVPRIAGSGRGVARRPIDHQGLYRLIEDSGYIRHAGYGVGEHYYTAAQMRYCLEARALDVVIFDLARVGGITPWRKLAAMGEAYNIPVCGHVAGSACAFAGFRSSWAYGRIHAAFDGDTGEYAGSGCRQNGAARCAGTRSATRRSGRCKVQALRREDKRVAVKKEVVAFADEMRAWRRDIQAIRRLPSRRSAHRISLLKS